jgi:hypothetical protein
MGDHSGQLSGEGGDQAGSCMPRVGRYAVRRRDPADRGYPWRRTAVPRQGSCERR